ncbi:MAG: leucyl aminopeptidase [Rhodomicrobium sp.]
MTQLPNISFAASTEKPRAETAIYFVPEGEGLPANLAELDTKASGSISKAMQVSGFKRKRKSTVEILAPAGNSAGRLLLVGLGDPKSLKELDWLDIGGTVRGKLHGKHIEAEAFFTGLDELEKEALLGFALGFSLRSYAFKKYKTKTSEKSDSDETETGTNENAPQLTIFSPFGEELGTAYKKSLAVSKSVYFARDLVNEPANILTPPEFAERLRELETHGVKVEVLDERALRSLGMNALLAVGQGSAQPTFAVILRWDGVPAAQSEENLVFIGKGVCFDTGGISIKPAQGMEDMKGDMAGAAAVAGAIASLAQRRAPVRAIGLVGLVENMPSGTAIRPGDIVTSASGQTIEVLNTDAEGRLVLADLLWYAQAHLKPRFLVTLATLTGAILVALGKENAGLFSNDDDLSSQIIQAGLDTGETAWRMPLSKKYNKMLDSKIADMKNIGGRDAGSVTAAQFLQRFVNAGVPWAHLDVAGTAIGSPATDINHSWASGYGVRLLDRLAGQHEI